MNSILKTLGRFFVLGSFAGAGNGASVYLGDMEPERTNFLTKVLTSGHVFFDIDANVGYYTVLASSLVGDQGTVIAFEPVIRNLYFLYRHIELNSIENAKIIPAACSDCVSIARFAAGDNFATGHLSSTGEKAEAPPLVRAQIVSTVSVDSIVQQMLLYPDVMKINVEGAELSVLRGSVNTLANVKPEVFLSVHSHELREQCLELLRALEYRCIPVDQHTSQPMEFYASRRVRPPGLADAVYEWQRVREQRR